jgi:hypothetical protein
VLPTSIKKFWSGSKTESDYAENNKQKQFFLVFVELIMQRQCGFWTFVVMMRRRSVSVGVAFLVLMLDLH